MSITVTQELFLINELEGEAREKALEWARDWNVADFEWYDFVLDYWKEELEKAGFLDADIQFSGFWSQGDGASFTADLDLHCFIEAHYSGHRKRQMLRLLELVEEGYMNVELSRSHRFNYVHERTVYVEEDSFRIERNAPRVYALWLRLVDDIDEVRMDYCHKIYRALEKEYEYLTSDENVAESLELNCVYFYPDGTPY